MQLCSCEKVFQTYKIVGGRRECVYIAGVYRWVVKSGLNGIYLTMELTDWLLVEVTLLLI
jgi:hypothetical protein